MFNKDRTGFIDLEIDVILAVERVIREHDTIYTKPEELEEQRDTFCSKMGILRESYDDVVLNLWRYNEEPTESTETEDMETAWYYSGGAEFNG